MFYPTTIAGYLGLDQDGLDVNTIIPLLVELGLIASPDDSMSFYQKTFPQNLFRYPGEKQRLLVLRCVYSALMCFFWMKLPLLSIPYMRIVSSIYYVVSCLILLFLHFSFASYERRIKSQIKVRAGEIIGAEGNEF